MHEKRQLSFLMTIFQSIDKSSGNPQIIYPLFRDNLSLLDEQLIPILTTWHQAKFTQINENGKQFISTVISILANLIAQFPLGSRAINLEIAIACSRLALQVYTLKAHPEDWAMTQVNLASVYQYRIRGDKAVNVEESIAYYRLALDVYTRAAYPEQWAGTQLNLANAYKEIDRVSEAISCYQSALEVLTPELLPLDCLTTARNLGDLAFKLGNWQLAIDTYDLAIQSVETSRTWATNGESRQKILEQALSVYENTIQAYINLDRIDLAIVTSERARSRQLVDLMATADLYKDSEILAEVKTYLTEYETLEQQIDRLRTNRSDEQRQQTVTRNRAALEADTAEIKQLEAEKQTIWQKIRQFDPILAGQQQVIPIDIAAIQSTINRPHTAILSFYTTDDDTHIFIITHNQPPQIHTCKEQGWQNFQVWLKEQWLTPYAENSGDWKSTVPTILGEIAQRIQIDRLVAKLTDITELIIIPHLFLHQIPFAALPIFPSQAGLEVGSKAVVLLGDRFTIRYAPSCQILKYCIDRPPSEYTDQYGTVENADGTLPGAGHETEQFAKMFAIHLNYRLQGKAATIDNFVALLQHPTQPVTHFHLASHAQSRLDRPLESALKLADGDLKLAKLMISRYPHLQEIFLSCCETHLGTTKITDDILTLGTGFLCAGARTVIGTLWSVNDIATALFSIFYYSNRRADYGRSESLKMAQFSLRELSGKDFELNHSADLNASLDTYARKIKAERKALDRQLNAGSIDQTTRDYEQHNLTSILNKTLEYGAIIEKYTQLDRPFEHPFYWAGFICQGLA